MISDEELYRQYLSGDETGLVELMKKYGNPLTLYINGYLHDIHEAEDLMIEVFSYLFAKRPHIRDGGFRAYLYKAARHLALRHKSIQRHHFCLDDLTKEPEGGKLVDEVIRTKERDQILHLCMGELHPDYREALYLTYFEGMSYRQVAEVMGKSVKQITNIMYLAVIFGASFVMSGISGQMVPGNSSGYETAATILCGGAAPEYIIIGVLSFLLGVCVTILCFRVHLLDKEDQVEQRGDRANGIDH